MMIVKCALDQKVEDLSKEKRRLRRREEVKKWLTIPGISLDRSDRYTLIKNATKSWQWFTGNSCVGEVRGEVRGAGGAELSSEVASRNKKEAALIFTSCYVANDTTSYTSEQDAGLQDLQWRGQLCQHDRGHQELSRIQTYFQRQQPAAPWGSRCWSLSASATSSSGWWRLTSLAATPACPGSWWGTRQTW